MMSLGFSECPHISVTLTNVIPHRGCLKTCLHGELDHGKLAMSSYHLRVGRKDETQIWHFG